MSVQVRFAENDDIPWLLTELEKFSKMYSSEVSLFGADEKYRLTMLYRLIEQHIFLVAVNDKNELLGFISGVLIPHHFNPQVRVLSEQFWWVKEEARGGSAGMRLMQKFIRIGQDMGMTQITFSRLANSPVKRETLERLGFKFREESYVMEVA